MKNRVGLKVYGRVQGVFFRDSTRRKAEELGLAGWVRNEQDGTIQIIAEGEGAALQKLIEWCEQGGPEYAEVEKVEINWQDPTNEFKNFVITPQQT